MPIPLKDLWNPSTSSSSHRRVIGVFRDWLQTEKPSFMGEPDSEKVAKYFEETTSSKEREKLSCEQPNYLVNIVDSAGPESTTIKSQLPKGGNAVLGKEEEWSSKNEVIVESHSRGLPSLSENRDGEEDDSSEVSASEFPLSKSDSVTTFCNSAASTLTIADSTTTIHDSNSNSAIGDSNVESFDGDSGAYDSEGVSVVESLTNPSMMAIAMSEAFMDGDMGAPSAGQRAPLVGDEVFTRIRSWSYSMAVGENLQIPPKVQVNAKGSSVTPSRIMHSVKWPPTPQPSFFVRAGLQKNLQLFIDYSATVFLRDLYSDVHPNHDHQVDLCKRVLNIYR